MSLDKMKLAEDFDEPLFAKLVDNMPQIKPSASLKAKVMSRIQTAAAPPDIRTIRADEGWFEYVPGVRVKLLFRDEISGARSFLADLAPGVCLPSHPHDFVEECIVLKGEITIGDYVIREGDYHLADGSTRLGDSLFRDSRYCWLVHKQPYQ